MIHIGVPVLKRYDLLRELLLSLKESTLPPSTVYIINNGGNDRALSVATQGIDIPIMTKTPDTPMSVAASWNWFLQHVPEERLIVNDDITFAPESLEMLVNEPEDFVSCGFGFSCFLIRNACMQKVGMFDESLSPGYAYFEDMDYLRRMRLVDIVDKVVQCGVVHKQSATPARYTSEEWTEHHRRFNLAKENYEVKWKNPPSWDDLKVMGGEGAHQ